MLWFENEKRAKIETEKCKFRPDFLAVFIDDIKSNRSLEAKYIGFFSDKKYV